MTDLGFHTVTDESDDATKASEHGADGATEVVPDLMPTRQEELAWSTAELSGPVDHRPLPRALRWLLIVVGVGLIAVSAFMVGQHAALHRPAPAASPPTISTPVPQPPGGPDGTYRIDIDGSQSTYTGKARPARNPSSVTTWWAFHTSCTGYVCKIFGVRLDPAGNHQNADISPSTGRPAKDTLVYVDGRWDDQVSPTLGNMSCDNGGSIPILATWWFSPVGPDGLLHGMLTDTADDDACGVSRGDAMHTPLVGTRIGPIPPGVL